MEAGENNCPKGERSTRTVQVSQARSFSTFHPIRWWVRRKYEFSAWEKIIIPPLHVFPQFVLFVNHSLMREWSRWRWDYCYYRLCVFSLIFIMIVKSRLPFVCWCIDATGRTRDRSVADHYYHWMKLVLRYGRDSHLLPRLQGVLFLPERNRKWKLKTGETWRTWRTTRVLLLTSMLIDSCEWEAV